MLPFACGLVVYFVILVLGVLWGCFALQFSCTFDNWVCLRLVFGFACWVGCFLAGTRLLLVCFVLWLCCYVCIGCVSG